LAFDDSDWSTNCQLQARCLRQLHEAIVEHHDELAELTIAEVGAPRMMVDGPQLATPRGYLTFYADVLEGATSGRASAARWAWPASRSTSNRSPSLGRPDEDHA
jgi:aldehyde dehydrogenase (NAD+)